MPLIKVCGLRRLEDVNAVNEFKPDYVGFVFAESKRQVTCAEAAYLVNNLKPCIKKVGVFVNKSRDDVEEIAMRCKLDVLQFHGDESPEYCASFKQEVWKSIRVKDEHSLDEIENFDVDGILLDAFSKDMYGGSGESFNWDLVNKYKGNKKLIIAGGLNIDNIVECIDATNPAIVDISSGVETDGFKDYLKIGAFIRKVRYCYG